MTNKILFVAGLGRCGTTATMTMLHHAGFPTFGEPPGFEPLESLKLTQLDRKRVASQQGKAVKWIDPLQCSMPFVDSCAIWLDRDPKQQARSQLKLGLLAPDASQIPRHMVQRVAKRIKKDTPRAFYAVHRRTDGRVLRLRFEDLINAPEFTANRIADFLSDQGFGDFHYLDMSRTIYHRETKCENSINIEVELAKQADRSND